MVLGFLQSRTYGFFASRQDFSIGGVVIIPKGWISPVWLFIAIGALFLLWFFLLVRGALRPPPPAASQRPYAGSAAHTADARVAHHLMPRAPAPRARAPRPRAPAPRATLASLSTP